MLIDFFSTGFDRNRQPSRGGRGFQQNRGERGSYYNDNRGRGNDRGGGRGNNFSDTRGGSYGGGDRNFSNRGFGGNDRGGDRGRANFGGRYGGFTKERERRPPQGNEEFKEPSAEEAADRPKLKLLPRTVERPINELAETKDRASIFGGARPRDEKVYEVRRRKESESTGSDTQEN